MSTAAPESKAGALTWTISVPLLNSPVVVRQTAGVLAVTFILVSLLVGAIFALDGDWAGMLPTLGLIALIHAGLWAVAVLVMAVLYRNRMTMRFHLDKRGASSEIVDRRAERTARMATVLGLATANFGAAGAGLLARSGARSFVSWRSVSRVRFDEHRCTIYLMGRWHTRAALFCTPENYPQAKRMVEKLCLPG